MDSRDVNGAKLMAVMMLMFGLMAAISYAVINMKHIKPLPIDAPLDRFSEARAMEHVKYLSQEIQSRQEGSPGLAEAARYIKMELEKIRDRAEPNLSLEIEETIIAGSFSMNFLERNITLAYRNHKNILMRVGSLNVQDSEPSVLVNAHYDGPLSSPGAGDCASCVASLLEIARLIVDTKWVPPQPVIFLFNGAEELFLLGAHGFTKTHRWRDSVGAFINIEASGTGGPDLVCQSGPGSWASQVYAQSALHPMAHSTAQDIFPIIPGDTDFRIFAEDYGIPGLDIIFLLGGYFYHTSFDTVDRIIPGSIQARGENLFRLIKAFSSSSNLHNAKEFAGNGTTDDRAVFFDYLTWFMIFYSGKEALIFHSLPLATFIAVPFFLSYPDFGISNWFVISCNLIAGTLYQLFQVVLAIIFPVIFAITRLLVSGHAMSWFTHPWLAFLMFVPSSLIGLLLPKFILDNIRFLELSDKCISDEVCFWGAFGYYALFTLAYQVAGLRGGFFTFMLSVFMIISRISCGLVSRGVKQNSFKRVAGYIVPSLPALLFASHFGIFLVQFLIEKMGMMGSLPQPYGYFVPDIIVAAAVGLVTGWCMGPLLPVVSSWLARPSIFLGLLHFSVAAMALSFQLFPYSTSAPKRVVLQHTYLTADASSLLDSRYEFSVVDANSLYFLFKHSPEAANLLHIGPTFSPETSSPSAQSSWTALYPISYLFGGSLKFPAKGGDVFEHYSHLPHLFWHNQTSMSSPGFRKVFLEFSLGALEEVWVTVLNITGPLSNWSFADYHVPAPESLSGGPPSYICRLSGRSQENWTFWLEANSSTDLRVDVAVVDRYLAEETKKLKSLFPNWVDVVTYSSYMSTYLF